MALRLKRLLRIGTKGLLVLIPLFGAVSLTFKHTVIDPAFYGDCKGIGDFNGDQQGDIAVGGSKLILYFSPDWRRITIALPKQEFTTDMEVADGDGDRDLDLVIPDSFQGELNWFENPRPKGNPEVSPWKHHILGWRGKPIHDVEVGDFNRDRKIDIVTRVKDGETLLWLQREPDNWVKVPIGTAERGEGTAIADINRDGYPDIVQNGYWLENPKSREGAWRKHPVVSRWPALAYVAVGDINKDGRPDIFSLLQRVRGSSRGLNLHWIPQPGSGRSMLLRNQSPLFTELGLPMGIGMAFWMLSLPRWLNRRPNGLGFFGTGRGVSGGNCRFLREQVPTTFVWAKWERRRFSVLWGPTGRVLL